MIFHVHAADGTKVRSTTRPTSVDNILDALGPNESPLAIVTLQPTQDREFASEMPISGHEWDSAFWQAQLSRWSMERRNARRNIS